MWGNRKSKTALEKILTPNPIYVYHEFIAVRYSDVKNESIVSAFEIIQKDRSLKILRKMTIEEIWKQADDAFHGLYFLFEQKTFAPLYIGKTGSWDLLNRVIQHIRWDGRYDDRHKDTSGAEEKSRTHISFLIADNKRDYRPTINELEPWFVCTAKPKYNKTYKNWVCDKDKTIKDFLNIQ